ncbi:MAG TPA: RDD family protein [Euzebyales bacterium]|nr:RDD family protein [Euzebyales bacterium]
MSNDPFDRPADPTPGWGDGASPNGGYQSGSMPGWDPIPTGGRPASVGKRAGAYIVDVIGLTIVVAILFAVTGLGGPGPGIAPGQSYLSSVAMALVAIAYFSIMEAGSGQTVAKRLFGIKTVSADGSPVSLRAAVMRRLPFYVGSVIPAAIGGLIHFVLALAILITAIQDEPERRALHDKWAGTKVIDA